MKSGKMEISRTALFIAVLVLAGWSTLFAQSTNWRDYLRSSEDANSSYVQERAQRRMAAATDPRYRDIILLPLSIDSSPLNFISVKDISRINVNQTYHSRTGIWIKDAELEELDRQISQNFLSFKIFAAQQSYSYSPSSAEDRSIEEIAQRVRAAGNRDAALRIMTSPPVSTKIEQIGITPQAFVTRLREAGINDADITRAAMNIEYIVAINGPQMDYVVRYMISFNNTPCMLNSVLRKLTAFRVNNHNDYNVIRMFLSSISTDLPNSRFMTTAQVLEFLDRNGHLYLYETIRFICGGGYREARIGDFITFCFNLQLAEFAFASTGDNNFNRLRSMGFTNFVEIALIMIACYNNPSSFNGVLSWNQTTINRVKQLFNNANSERTLYTEAFFNTLRSIVGITEAAWLADLERPLDQRRIR